jgi:anti-sigma B factor antagonist
MATSDLEMHGSARRLTQFCSMRVEYQLDKVLIRMQGEFDLSCEEPFRAELAGALGEETTTLVLDLSGLTFIDSVGLGMLVKIQRETGEDGLGFSLHCAEGNVRSVLRQTGLDGVLPVVDPFGVVPRSESPV